MLLGNEIGNLFSKLFASSNAKAEEVYNLRAARNEYNKPLMQIVENRVSKKHKEAGMRRASTSGGFAAEVGPPPLTPATLRR